MLRRISELNPKKTTAQDPLFDLWRYHALFSTTMPEGSTIVAADKAHGGMR